MLQEQGSGIACNLSRDLEKVRKCFVAAVKVLQTTTRLSSRAGHQNTSYSMFAAFVVSHPYGQMIVTGSEDHSISLYGVNSEEVRLCVAIES